MKKLIVTSILAALVTFGTTVMAQNYSDEYLGLPGDNLNLYAVMKLFQESQTLEGFERNLNDENSRINNLDLNGDNMIDYITVTDYVDGNVHNIVLRAALNRNETQDVAVFTVQRFRDGSVQIQLVGDEALYGKNYIIEPIYNDNNGETPNPGYSGRGVYRDNVTVVRTTTFEIATWPLVRFIYMPDYVLWHSSWYWGYYPSYWHPWRPFYWHYYYGYHYNWNPVYYGHYRHWQHNRYARYDDFYYRGIRSHSPDVNNRIREGNYRSTYSHPEQRREGAALYSSVNPGRNARTPDDPVATRANRRSVPQQAQERNTSRAGNSSERRSVNTATDRAATRTEKGQNAGTSRRASATVSDRATSRPDQSQRAASRPEQNQRAASTPQQSQRAASRPEQSQRAASTPQQSQRAASRPEQSQRAASTPQQSQRAASRPEQSQKAERSRASRQSSGTVRSSGNKSSERKAGTNATKSERTKDSKTSKSTGNRR